MPKCRGMGVSVYAGEPEDVVEEQPPVVEPVVEPVEDEDDE